MMRICVFDDLPEGGAKRVVFEQIKRLSLNHVVDYVTNDILSIFPFERYAHEVFRFPFRLRQDGGLSRPLQELSYYARYISAYKQIASLIRGMGSEVVLVHPSRLTQAPGLLNYLSVPTVYFAEEWPRVVYEPELHPLPASPFTGAYEWGRRKWIKQLDREAVSHASMIVTTSRYMQQQLQTIYNRSVALLPLGVDSAVFYPLKTSLVTRHFFLFVGEPTEMNGYPLLAPLVRQFHIRTVRFHKGRFCLTDASLKTLYRQAIATLCLAPNEPFGLSAIESMACETPVIAISSGGYLDTVQHRKSGIVIKPETKALKSAMQLLTQDRALRDRLGKWGRAHVVRQYAWERHILQLESYLREVCHG